MMNINVTNPRSYMHKQKHVQIHSLDNKTIN